MGKSIRITGVWLLVLAFYMPLMAQKNIALPLSLSFWRK